MAVLTAPVVLAGGGGNGLPRWIALGFQNVTLNDTFDLSTLTTVRGFTTLVAAFFVATSNRTETDTLCTLSGTVATVKGTGVAADSGVMFAVGT